ncbi:MAG: hypothetical protein PHV42_04485, partial [Candidatus Pacebacteria bacterium]|nr:hypothetical protein [Candidatus Paceibacterota bacterium]
KEAEISIESNKISTGVEYRRINREASVNYPEAGKKTVYRVDTGEELGIQDMTLQELQRELPFGDAVKPEDGEPEKKAKKAKKEVFVEDETVS